MVIVTIFRHEGNHTCGRKSPGGATIALIHNGMNQVTPFLSPIKTRWQDVIDVNSHGRHLLHRVHGSLGAQFVMHSLIQSHTPQEAVVGRLPSEI